MKWGGAVPDRAHNPVPAGSTPAPATTEAPDWYSHRTDGDGQCWHSTWEVRGFYSEPLPAPAFAITLTDA